MEVDEDDEIDRLLRALPRVAPSDGFERRVMAALPAGPRRSRVPWLAAAVAAACVVLAAWRLVPRAPAPEGRTPEAELAALQAEHAALHAELEALRRRARPVIGADGYENVDLVVRLDEGGL